VLVLQPRIIVVLFSWRSVWTLGGRGDVSPLERFVPFKWGWRHVSCQLSVMAQMVDVL